MKKRLNAALSGVIPEYEFVVKSDFGQNVVRLSPVAQIGIGALAIGSVSWMAFTSAAFVLNFVIADSKVNQAEVLTGAYEIRLAELTRERDRRALEARTAQERFGIALTEMSNQQTELLENIGHQRELETGIDLMRAKLQAAVDERDAAHKRSEVLLAELTDVSGDLNIRVGGENALSGTLSTISEALSNAVKVRDTAVSERDELRTELDTLALKVQVQAERQEYVMTRLEEAVTMSFTPLEDMFKSSGMDVDSLISGIRRTYSGTGGPLVGVTYSQNSFGNPELGARFDALMDGLDKVNAMQLAATKLPYATPVNASFRYTSGFGVRRDPITGGHRAHNGVDLAGPHGTPILATGDGVVVFAGRQSGYGNFVKIRHEFGIESSYAHMSAIHVNVGQRVSRGDHIGNMGNTGRSTGTHLHYEIRQNGKPLNPMTYIRAARNVF